MRGRLPFRPVSCRFLTLGSEAIGRVRNDFSALPAPVSEYQSFFSGEGELTLKSASPNKGFLEGIKPKAGMFLSLIPQNSTNIYVIQLV